MSATADAEPSSIDRIDAVSLAAAVGLGVIALAYGFLTQRILLALLVAVFLGGVTAGALVVRRVV